MAVVVAGDLTVAPTPGPGVDPGDAGCLLSRAAWLGVVDLTPAPTDLDRAGYHRALTAAGAWLREVDARGPHWPMGLLAEVEWRTRGDARFDYLRALPRSVLFGETLARALLGPGARPDLAIEAARLVNLFVTCFDGICDETQELLPETVPHLRDLVAALPGPPPPAAAARHPLVTLTHAVAGAVARAVATVPDGRAAVAGTVRTAFDRQLATLRPPEEPVAAERERLSAVTFSVTFALTAACAAATEPGTEALLAAAPAVGAFFGWVDDLVDLPADLRTGRPNMVAASATAAVVADRDPEVLRGIRIEAGRRWTGVLDALARVRAADPALAPDADRMLLPAAWAWLGFPTSDPDSGPTPP